jgi:Cys-rich protein (TIGR01571 family)
MLPAEDEGGVAAFVRELDKLDPMHLQDLTDADFAGLDPPFKGGEQSGELAQTDGRGICWGGCLAGSFEKCTDILPAASQHFKHKLCPSCQTDGIWIPSACVRVVDPQEEGLFTNIASGGVWTQRPWGGWTLEFRVVNQTAKCRGSRLVISKHPLPDGLPCTPVPAEWLEDGRLKLISSKGTLVPHMTVGVKRPPARAPVTTEPVGGVPKRIRGHPLTTFADETAEDPSAGDSAGSLPNSLRSAFSCPPSDGASPAGGMDEDTASCESRYTSPSHSDTYDPFKELANARAAQASIPFGAPIAPIAPFPPIAPMVPVAPIPASTVAERFGPLLELQSALGTHVAAALHADARCEGGQALPVLSSAQRKGLQVLAGALQESSRLLCNDDDSLAEDSSHSRLSLWTATLPPSPPATGGRFGGEWSSGLFDCFGDVRSWLCLICCCPCLAGQVWQRAVGADRPNMVFVIPMALVAVIFVCIEAKLLRDTVAYLAAALLPYEHAEGLSPYLNPEKQPAWSYLQQTFGEGTLLYLTIGGLIISIFLLALALFASIRTLVRKRDGIKGSISHDFWITACCFGCGLCQLVRHEGLFHRRNQINHLSVDMDV